MSVLRMVAKAILLFQIMFSKPQWCKIKGQEIDVASSEQENCSKDTNDVSYFRSQVPVFDTGMDTYITISCLLFLSISRLYALRVNNASDDALSTAVACLVLTVMYIAFSILHGLKVLSFLSVQDIISMVFILLYQDSIRRASLRMLRIAVESIEVLIIFACALLAFACMARILFFGTLG